jgi:hypothetical protein
MAQLNVNIDGEVKEAFRNEVEDEYGTVRKMGEVVERLLVEWLDERNDEEVVTNRDLLAAIEELRAQVTTAEGAVERADDENPGTSRQDDEPEGEDSQLTVADLRRSILKNYSLKK